MGGPSGNIRAITDEKKEMDELESCLRNSDRPMSVMLFGQRRIGKTSLLLEIVQSHPPASHRISAIHVDVSELNFANEPGAMSLALFNAIVGAMCNSDENALFCNTLKESFACNDSVDLRTVLMRGIDARASFSTALELLVARLVQRTEERVDRIAIIIDEFDRFVEPYLSDRKQEVQRLAWGLRKIATVSQRIALVLAGSGMMRVFVDDLRECFMGVFLKCNFKLFNLTKTTRRFKTRSYLPCCPRLCPDRFADVVARAWELSGGHPYFLAMLGYSAALVSRGRRLTPALLNRVSELMVKTKLAKTVYAAKFYAYNLELLDRLHDYRPFAARILLAHIASLTTPESPWISWNAAADAPELRRLPLAERLEVLKLLENDQILESDDRGMVRIRVPLTAAALRVDGHTLRQKASEQLTRLVNRGAEA